MGELRNCPQCGKVFMYMVRNLCPACIELEEQQYEDVRTYLRKNPGAQVEQIVEDTGVDEAKVMRWLRDGRLEVADAGGRPVLTCQRCGRRVEKGTLCPTCMQVLAQEIKAAKGPHGRPATGTDKPVKNDRDDRHGMYIRNRDGD